MDLKRIGKKPIKVMGFPINKAQIIGMTMAIVIILIDIIFFIGTNLFYFIGGLAFVIGGFPFFLYLIFENNSLREKETMFLEFSRNLVENVRSGTPISKSILNVRKKDFGALNPHVNKLANQIALGIPIQTAFETFGRDLNSQTISRAITIISESEKAGGQIETILDSVVKSVGQIEKLRKERRSAIYNLVVQGYIIFFIFIIIILIMEFKILPIATGLTENLGGVSGSEVVGEIGGVLGGGGKIATPEQLTRPFLWFIIIQGFFTGLVIGKLSEGKIRPGLKHSFILVVVAILINTGSKVFIRGALAAG
jgi:flagellar protein FlaJ